MAEIGISFTTQDCLADSILLNCASLHKIVCMSLYTTPLRRIKIHHFKNMYFSSFKYEANIGKNNFHTSEVIQLRKGAYTSNHTVSTTNSPNKPEQIKLPCLQCHREQCSTNLLFDDDFGLEQYLRTFCFPNGAGGSPGGSVEGIVGRRQLVAAAAADAAAAAALGTVPAAATVVVGRPHYLGC